MWGSESILSVRELTGRIRLLIDGAPELRDVLVRGEVSNFKDHPSGHLYFTLKDEAAALRCVMFRSRRDGIRGWGPPGGGAPLRNGEVVVAQGYVSVYERDGQYQLYVQRLWRDAQMGLGELYRALEELKARLRAEGLFDAARKRLLPLLPRCVAMVTSPTGAALRDMIRVMRRRYPNVHLVLVPALVQGDRAPSDIARAIALANRWGGADVIIVGRGGGSMEELWAFNTEEVARALAASAIPTVSAVGHETDFTIADLAADVRAPTPSAAAEMVVPEKRVLQARVGELAARLEAALRRRVLRDRQRLERLCSRPVLARPVSGLDQRRQRVDDLEHRLILAARNGLERFRMQLGHAGARLQALDPTAVLSRGYSLCLGPDGRPVSSVRRVSRGDRVRIVVRDGVVRSLVEEAEEGLPWASGGRAAE